MVHSWIGTLTDDLDTSLDHDCRPSFDQAVVVSWTTLLACHYKILILRPLFDLAACGKRGKCATYVRVSVKIQEGGREKPGGPSFPQREIDGVNGEQGAIGLPRG